MDGYNSSDYGNRNFTVIEVNETGGGESIKYSIAGIGSTGGTYDTNNAFGRVVKVDDFGNIPTKSNKKWNLLKEKR